jgi:hypothetical protein
MILIKSKAPYERGRFCDIQIQLKPLIMITLGLALFDNNNRPITLSEGYKNLHYLTQFIVTVQPSICIKKQKNLF